MIQNSEYLIHELKLLHFREICKVRALRAGQLKVESCLSMLIQSDSCCRDLCIFCSQDASKGPCLPRRFQLLLASAYEFLADSFFAEAGSLMAVDGFFGLRFLQLMVFLGQEVNGDQTLDISKHRSAQWGTQQGQQERLISAMIWNM